MAKKISELFNFQGKTVIVTGGAMGIGYGIVGRFAEAKANVVIADMSPEGKKKAEAISKEYGVKTLFIKTDVSSEGAVKKMVTTTVKKFGKVDVLVNDAGIFPSVPVLKMDLKLWEKIQSINLRGVFLCCREAGKAMVKSGGGSIVNIASVDALHPSAVGLASYDASKHGVWGFTKNLALEVAGNNIRVNAVAPGGVRTEGVEKMTGGAVKAAASAQAPAFAPLDVPMKRMGEPDEIALATLFVASEAASYMTGSIVVVDGGMLLK